MFLISLNCNDQSLAAILTVIKNILQVIQIIGPIVAIIALSLHFFQLMRDPDNKKAVPKIKNSMIALVVLFFVPLLVDVVFSLLGSSTTFSACWNSSSSKITTTPTYQPIDSTKKQGLITDPTEYQKGSPKPSTSTSSASNLPSQVNDSKYDQYQQIASCDSDTLKYRIIKANGQDLAIIWVQNPNQQLKLALAASNSKGRSSAEQILSNEISANNYQNKCLVAINASFFSYSTNSPVSAVVIQNGNIVKNEGNASGCIGVDSSNKLIECSHESANDIVSKGVKNTFGISSSAGLDNSGPTANRTQICQIDSNNFVLLSGSGTVGGAAQITKNVTGCSYSYNLDGGGSRKLYYKTKDSSSPVKVFGGSRTIPDMLYFAEA